MDQTHFVPADLDDSAIEKLQSLEQSLHDISGDQIVIIAYKPSEGADVTKH